MLRSVGKGKWQCARCLSVRTSLAAYRWPQRCSAAAAKREVFPQTAWQSLPSGDQLTSHDLTEEPVVPIVCDMDNENYDPFDDLNLEEDEHRHQDPEVEHMADDAVQPPAQPALVQPPAALGSWWDRVGEVIPADDLRIGGAIIHHTHAVCTYGNQQCRSVFCAHCGGSTLGGYSPVLAAGCSAPGTATNMRRANRMLQGKWPQQQMQDLYGRGEASAIIRFIPHQEGMIIVRAAAASGGRTGSHGPVAPGTA